MIMTSYIAQTLYRQDPSRWGGRWRHATREQAEACLAAYRREYSDILLATRIVESPLKPHSGNKSPKPRGSLKYFSLPYERG